jgi:LppP/LprE lipoprotein
VPAALPTAILVALLLVVGGCADDSSDDAAATTTTDRPATTTTEPEATTTSTTPAEDPLTEAEAAALVEALDGPYGTWVADTSAYDPAEDLSAIVGSSPDSTVSSPQQVFFFHRGRYVEVPLDPRSGIEVASVEGGTVTVTYAHYRPADPNCCPSLPDYSVRFRGDGTTVIPLDPLPPPDQGTAG